MNKCECYRIRTERRYFSDYEKGYAAAQGKLLPDYEDIRKGACLGTKEVDSHHDSKPHNLKWNEDTGIEHVS